MSLAVLAWMLSPMALGQDANADIERFRPAVDPYGYASVESADTLGHLQMSMGMWGNFADDPLVLIQNGERYFGDGTNKDDGVIDIRTAADLQIGLGLSDYFSFTIDAPVVLWQEGNKLVPLTATGVESNVQSYGPGDLRIAPKVTFLDMNEGMVGLAVMAQVSVPTGWGVDFIAEQSLGLLAMGILEFADGSVPLREYRIRGAVNIGGRLRQPYQFNDVTLGNELVYRVGLSGLPTELLELGAEVYGATGGPTPTLQPLEVIGWFRLLPLDWISLTAGGGVGALPGDW